MSKLQRILVSLVTIAVLIGCSAIPVSAATVLYGYPQFVAQYLCGGRIIARGLDNTRAGTNYQLDIIISTIVDGTVNQAVAVAADGAALVDESAESIEDTGNDMTLLPAVPAENDAYYIGSTVPFNGVRIDIGTQGEGVWTTVWEYWNGTAWANITATDTDGVFTAAAGNHNVTWTIPTAWVKKTVTTTTPAATTASLYYVRARVSAYTSVVTAPAGDQAWILCDNVISGTVALLDVAGTISECTGWVGYGRRPNFVLCVKDVQDATGLFAEIQGTIVWDGTTVSRISGRMTGHYSTGTGTVRYLSGSFTGSAAE